MDKSIALGPSVSRGSISAGTVYNLIGRFAFLLSGYALHIGLARILGPAGYGVVGLVVLWLINIARVLVTDGARPAISKFTAENEGLAAAVRGAGLRLELLFSALVVAALLVFAGPLAALLHDPSLAPYIRLSAPMVPIMAVVLLYQASLNGLRAFGRQAIVNIIYSAGRVAFALLGAWLWGVPGAVLGLVTGPLLSLVAGRLLLPAGRPGGRFPARRIIAFTLPLIPFAVGGALLMCLDLLLVKALLGEGAEVGYYTSAITVSEIPYYALIALVDTLLPVTAHLLARDQRPRARQTIATGLRYGLLLLIPGSALISATARALAVFLYSGAFAPAGGPLTVLIWGQTFFAFFSVLTAILTAEGKPGQAMALMLGMLPLSAALNLALIPRYGLVGAACSTTAATLAGCVASFLLVRRDFGPVLRGRSVLAIVVAALASAALAGWWAPQGWLLIPAYLALWGVDILLLILLGEFKRDDLQRLRGLTSRLLGRSA